MKHSIISWDCSYRNFFHLIDGMLWQRYPKEDFELIYVEQKSKEVANTYNHSLGLKSLEDRYNEVRDKINIKIIYLNEPDNIPIHFGKCSNAGIELAKGEIISVIDGDLFFPPDFLEKLSDYHSKTPSAVVDIFRKDALYPAAVSSFKDWKKASYDFYKCLNTTPDKYGLVVDRYGFGGPMISAKRNLWEKTGGYDPHVIWSTNLTKAGGDHNFRMEIASGNRSVCLPDCFAVHPWHPAGIRAKRQEEATLKYYALLDELTQWSVDNKKPHHKDRKEVTDTIYKENESFFNEFITLYLEEEKKEIFYEKNMLTQKIICKYKQLRGIFGRIRRGIFSLA